MKKFSLLSSAIFTALSLSVCSATAGTYYIPHTINKFDPLNNYRLQAMTVTGLNNNGEMVGMIDEGDRGVLRPIHNPYAKAVYWKNYNEPSILPLPAYEPPPGDLYDYQDAKTGTSVYDINDDGTAVGKLFKFQGRWPTLPYLLRPRAVEWTQTGVNGAYELQYNDNPDHWGKNATTINSQGDIALSQSSFIHFDLKQANGTYTSKDVSSVVDGLHALWPEAINDNGMVSLSNRQNLSQGAIYRADGTMFSTSGSANGYDYGAVYRGINNNGDSAGTRVRDFGNGIVNTVCHYTNFDTGAFDYEFDARHLIPALPSYNPSSCYLYDVNSSGVAVGNMTGSISNTLPSITVGFTVDRETGNLTDIKSRIQLSGDLTAEDFDSLHLRKINDHGAILGYNGESPLLEYDSGGNQTGWRNGNHDDDVYYYFEPKEAEQTVDNSDDTYASQLWIPIASSDLLIFIPSPEPHWQLESSTIGAHNDDYMKAVQGDGAYKYFTWNLDVPIDATYSVKAKWLGDGINDQNAVYEIRNGNTLIGTITKDQTQSSTAANGDTFELLGSYSLSSSEKLTVTLSGSGQGNLIADAIRIDLVD
ncbi:MAG: hypothetical protein HRT35_06305 [Algicola sp.]|nr:hypothetical protein [Algicola sp.]